MKILLSENQLQKLITELGDTDHVIDRLYQRFNKGFMTVFVREQLKIDDKGYGGPRVRFIPVGEYYFSQEEMNDINNKIKLLFSYDYRKNGSFGVEIKRFDIPNRINQIRFYGEDENREYYKNLAIKHRNELCFSEFGTYFSGGLDKGSKEWGNAVAIIIRNNDATTIYWGDGNKFSPQYFGTEYHIKRVETFVEKNSTKPSEVPDSVRTFIGQNQKAFTKNDDSNPEDTETNGVEGEIGI